MSHTRTGNFPIGFRRLWSDWQADLSALIDFAKAEQFQSVDVGVLPDAELKQILDAGLKIGTVDLAAWPGLSSADAGKRKDAAQQNIELIRRASALGVKAFFVVVLPEDPAAPREENLKRAADGFTQVCDGVKDTGARIAIEGWPGPDPIKPALACTPESYAALFDAVGSDVMGVNFDPSHLIRMGIDSVRFCREFVDRIAHVHAKDTDINAEATYLYGHEQPATLAKAHGFGAHAWRYTIPGHGVARWSALFSILADAGYKGGVSIELEDEAFFGSDDDQKLGFVASREFLKYA